MTPAARFLRDTIQGMADAQQIILNGQQASRDLMGVMIQDNLNLKGEAGSLRERMLELERELAEQRRALVEDVADALDQRFAEGAVGDEKEADHGVLRSLRF